MATIDPPIPVVDESRDDIIDVDVALEGEVEKLVTNIEPSQKSTSVDHRVKEDKSKGKVNESVLKTIPWPPPPFPEFEEKKGRKVSEFLVYVEKIVY